MTPKERDAALDALLEFLERESAHYDMNGSGWSLIASGYAAINQLRRDHRRLERSNRVRRGKRKGAGKR